MKTKNQLMNYAYNFILNMIQQCESVSSESAIKPKQCTKEKQNKCQQYVNEFYIMLKSVTRNTEKKIAVFRE